MSVLFGLYQPEEGEIRKDGRNRTYQESNDANALGIGMVHQHFKLVECFSVLDNIILGAEPVQGGFLKKEEARKKVMELSKRYPSDRSGRYCREHYRRYAAENGNLKNAVPG